MSRTRCLWPVHVPGAAAAAAAAPTPDAAVIVVTAIAIIIACAIPKATRVIPEATRGSIDAIIIANFAITKLDFPL